MHCCQSKQSFLLLLNRLCTAPPNGKVFVCHHFKNELRGANNRISFICISITFEQPIESNRLWFFQSPEHEGIFARLLLLEAEELNQLFLLLRALVAVNRAGQDRVELGLEGHAVAAAPVSCMIRMSPYSAFGRDTFFLR
jgi:hypothetical protein